MPEIHIAKYSALRPDDEVPENTVIRIDRELPDFKSLQEAESYYYFEANRLMEALGNSLPGGTFDRLLIALMRKKVSFYMGKPET